jgi:hypothetical protein
MLPAGNAPQKPAELLFCPDTRIIRGGRPINRNKMICARDRRYFCSNHPAFHRQVEALKSYQSNLRPDDAPFIHRIFIQQTGRFIRKTRSFPPKPVR